MLLAAEWIGALGRESILAEEVSARWTTVT